MNQKHILDRVYRQDLRSLNFLISAPEEFPLRSYTWACDVVNDQGSEGACVGFGWGHELCAKPSVNLVDGNFSRNSIYIPARGIDEFEDSAGEGTSVLAGAKIVRSLGYMTEFRWSLSVWDWAYGIVRKGGGPAVIGVDWHEGMWDTDAEGFIHATGPVMGGHCVLTRGVRIVWKDPRGPRTNRYVDLDRSYFLIHNSWGPRWGVNGTAKLSFRDAELLLNNRGEVCFATNRRRLVHVSPAQLA